MKVRATRVTLAAAVGGLVAMGALTMARSQQGAQEQRPPVFRAGATFVNVDAYPRRDGRLLQGLGVADFEVLEDGKAQQVESFEFVRIPPNTPDAERRDPNSVADALRQAADPHNRLFVIYLDPYHTTIVGSHDTQRPVVEFLTRTIGATDLFGFMTPDTPIAQLTFGRRTETIAAELEKHWTWGLDQNMGAEFIRDEMERRLAQCMPEDPLPLFVLNREDRFSTSLADLMTRLGSLRDERKNLLLISEGWVPRGGAQPGAAVSPMRSLPQVGVSSSGRLGLGNDPSGGRDGSWCESEIARLRGIDFISRFRDLLTQAALANVAVYPIDVGGLKTGTSTADGITRLRERQDTLRTLASNTDGAVVMDTNDLTGAVRKVADDLSAFYLLGYYSSNTAADGRYRRIEVKVKQDGVRTSARRGYLAPTPEMRRAADAASATPARAEMPAGLTAALADLGRVRDDTRLFGAGVATAGRLDLTVEIATRESANARWARGGALTLRVSDAAGTVTTAEGAIEPGARSAAVSVPVDAKAKAPWTVAARLSGTGEPLEQTFEVSEPTSPRMGEAQVFRATPAPRSPLRPAADRQFRRTERLHMEWSLGDAAPERTGRLLNAQGEALALPITLSERQDGAQMRLVGDINLAPLSEGNYVVEVAAGAGDNREIRYVAFRIVR